jgi:uncharacterized membrane protein YgdD (TMEM256/DUF423 family)
MSGTFWLRVGAISGFLAVGAGAFGAHSLKKSIGPDELAVFETGVRYQMFHALAMVAVGVIAGTGRASRALATAGWGFFVGSVLFSGSLYGLALTGARWLGPITPIGGVGFLVGWAALASHRAGFGKDKDSIIS